MTHKLAPVITKTIGALLLIIVWLSVKYGFDVSDRYLPSAVAVIRGFSDLDPSLLSHTIATLIRLVSGFLFGLVFGTSLALLMHRYSILFNLLNPAIQALRSVPPIATVPFFLIWFGFAEIGKFLLIVIGIGLNVLVGALQILSEFPQKYDIALRSMGHSPNTHPMIVALPLVLERILPTLRTSLSIAFGVVIVAELLGAQLGLGYLIQTSRTTYSIHVIFLAAAILGLMNAAADKLLVSGWRRIVFWNTNNTKKDGAR